MKKGLSFLIVFSVIFSILFLYIFFKVYTIFGFWNMIWTGITELIFFAYFKNLIGSRVEKDNIIVYNPKELPKLVSILVSVLLSYYLYNIMNSKPITTGEYIFGICYLVLLGLIPALIMLYKLIRDRNDFITISSDLVKYRDNDEMGEFAIKDIKSIDLLGNITLTMLDDSKNIIKISQMNFNMKDALSVYAEIKSRIPKIEEKTEPIQNHGPITI